MQTTDPIIGTMLQDRFEILEVFSTGGMGKFYKARDKSNGETVAVRILHSSRISDKQAIKRFENALGAAKYMKHSHIVHVITSGVSDQGAPYLVYPFIEAKNLRSMIAAQGTISPAQTEQIAKEIATALGHAHSKGIVHRNLKPGNVLLVDKPADSPTDYPEHTMLTGFGIAKPISDINKSLIHITQTNKVVGSPTYMSPEQFMNKPLDARSDIYALGCLMYEMLAGHPPFESKNVLRIMSSHMVDIPEKLAGPQSAVPEYLDNIVRLCMQKDPKDRYQSMGDLITDIESHTCRVPAEKIEQSWPAPKAATIPSKVGLSTTAVAVGCGLFLIALVASGFQLWNKNSPSSNVSLSEATGISKEEPGTPTAQVRTQVFDNTINGNSRASIALLEAELEIPNKSERDTLVLYELMGLVNLLNGQTILASDNLRTARTLGVEVHEPKATVERLSIELAYALAISDRSEEASEMIHNVHPLNKNAQQLRRITVSYLGRKENRKEAFDAPPLDPPNTVLKALILDGDITD